MDKEDLEFASKIPPEFRNEVQEPMAQAYAGIQAVSKITAIMESAPDKIKTLILG